MGRPSLILLILLAVVGSWMFFNEVPLHRMPWGTQEVASSGTTQLAMDAGGDSRAPTRIRVATFNLDHFDVQKAAQDDVVAALAHILSRFHVVAVQEVRSSEHHLLPRVIDEMNRLRAGNYEFIVGPRVGREDLKYQFGFVFDRQAVEIDRLASYSINDPDDLINREPLVGCFRSRSTATNKAFTFSLVNVHTDKTECQRENGLLRTIFASVRNDGRLEDDVLLLGNFCQSAERMETQNILPGMTFIVGDANAHVASENNIVLDAAATTEFTGRSGVFDIVRELNVDQAFAARVSRHAPVWAEFSAAEGGTPGRVAARKMPITVR